MIRYVDSPNANLRTKGYFVAEEATTQTPCALAGTYAPNSGSRECVNAAAGYYVDNTGATEQKECPRGRYSDTSATSCTDCEEGYSRPGRAPPLAQEREAGYCAASADAIIECPLAPTQHAGRRTRDYNDDARRLLDQGLLHRLNRSSRCPG